MDNIRRKVVIVGDPGVGKTSLLMSYSKKHFTENQIPTVLEPSVKVLEIDGKYVELSLWDTAGSESTERLRPLAYPDSHVILMCFAIDSPPSLWSVRGSLITEVLHFCKGIPIILVGCKRDLRGDPYDNETLDDKDDDEITLVDQTFEDDSRAEQSLTTDSDIMRARQVIGANVYIECSAETGKGVEYLFEYAARLALVASRPKCHKPCVIL